MERIALRNERGSVGVAIAAFVGALVLMLALTWIVQGNDFFMYKVFAPRQEQVRRETFERSKAYNQGMIQELSNMQFEYCRADAEHRAALGRIVLHRAADFDIYQPQVPSDLRAFILALRAGAEDACK